MWARLIGIKDKGELQPLIGDEKGQKKQKEQKDNFEYVPNEIMQLIFTKLPNKDIASISRTNKIMHDVAENTNTTYEDITNEAKIVGTFSQIRSALNERTQLEQKISAIKKKDSLLCFDTIKEGATLGALYGVVPGVGLSMGLWLGAKLGVMSMFSLPISMVAGSVVSMGCASIKQKNEQELNQLKMELDRPLSSISMKKV